MEGTEEVSGTPSVPGVEGAAEDRRMADIYLTLHVRAYIDSERIDDDEYVRQVAADAIYAGDVLDDELWSVDFAD